MVAKQQFRVTTDTLSPLYKASIGFDQLVNEFFNEPSFVNTSGYPPYNISKGADDVYEITLAVAGFKKAKATTMATVLLQVAESEGINPLTYFDDPDKALTLTQDSYDAMNNIRPAGNRISVTTAINNSKNTRLNNLIQP